jgi:hypothetical protein
MKRIPKSMAEIESYAHDNLLHYGGNEEEYGLINQYNYTGEGDEFLFFNGEGHTFKNEISAQRTIVLQFNNPNEEDEVVNLFPSLSPVEGYLIVSDGNVGGNAFRPGMTPLSFSCNPRKWSFFQQWIKFRPTRITSLKLNCTNQSQHGESITILPCVPWINQSESRSIQFELHSNEMKQQLTITTIKEAFQVDGEQDVLFRIKGGTSGKLTFFVGAVFSPRKALMGKAKMAGAATGEKL